MSHFTRLDFVFHMYYVIMSNNKKNHKKRLIVKLFQKSNQKYQKFQSNCQDITQNNSSSGYPFDRQVNKSSRKRYFMTIMQLESHEIFKIYK